MQYLKKEEIDIKKFRKELIFENTIEAYSKTLKFKKSFVFIHKFDGVEHMMQIIGIKEHNSLKEKNVIALKLEESYYGKWFLYELSAEESFKDAEIPVDVWGIELTAYAWLVKLRCPDCGKEGVISIS